MRAEWRGSGEFLFELGEFPWNANAFILVFIGLGFVYISSAIFYIAYYF